jgi:aromatic ring-opening dioxygenase LigB subunit
MAVEAPGSLYNRSVHTLTEELAHLVSKVKPDSRMNIYVLKGVLRVLKNVQCVAVSRSSRIV